MAWIAAAAIGGALITSSATRSASKTQSESTDRAVLEDQRQFDLQRSDGAPYRAAGVNALQQFQTLTNTPTTAADVMQDPGYAFGLEQGQQAIDRKVSAMGGRVSGQALKAAARFGVSTATAGYTAADQRRNDRLNRLAAIAGIGQSSTNASAAAGSASAANTGNLITAQGNAAGAAQIAQGNTWANAGNQIAALYGRTQSPTVSPNSPGGANSDGWGAGKGYGNQDLGGYF